MRTKHYFIVTVSVIFLIALFAISGYAQADQNELTSEQARISRLPINTLLNEMVKIYENENDIYAGMDYAMILKDRIDELEHGTIKNAIENKKISEVVRVTLLQLSRELKNKNESMWNRLYSDIAADSTEMPILRQNAIISLPTTPSSTAILSEIISKEDGIIAFQALKKMNIIEPKRATQLSEIIIANWEQEEELKLSQALKVKARNIKENKSVKETDRFIATCDNILKSAGTQNLHDTVFFALEKLEEMDAIKVIIKNDNIDEVLKKYCILENRKMISVYLDGQRAKGDKDFFKIDKLYKELDPHQHYNEQRKVISENEIKPKSKDYSGYAIYRDGALWGLNWHAGLMAAPTATTNKCVIHMNNLFAGVKLDTFSNFMDKSSNDFKGVYRPKSGLTTSQKTEVIATARELTTEQIPYIVSQQLDYYNKTSNGTQKGEPSDISNIRCDGVVEYCYEYNGIRIYGNDNYWDISRRSLETLNHHAATKITPKKQAETCMTLYSTSMPGHLIRNQFLLTNTTNYQAMSRFARGAIDERM